MPNWTTNAVALRTGDLRRVVGDRGEVDFNLVRPMPRDLMLDEGGMQGLAVEAASRPGASEDDATPLPSVGSYGAGDGTTHLVRTVGELVALGRRYLRNQELYGAQTWYGWSVANWGTKWNATGTHVTDLGGLSVVTFETAWSPVARDLLEDALGPLGEGWYGEWCDEDYFGIQTYDGRLVDAADATLLAEASEEDGYGTVTWGEPREGYDLARVEGRLGQPAASLGNPAAADVVRQADVVAKALRQAAGAVGMGALRIATPSEGPVR